MNNTTTKYIDAEGPVSTPYVDHAGPPNHRHREITQPEATAAGHQRTMMTGRVEEADQRVPGYGRVDVKDDPVQSFDFVRKGTPTAAACRQQPVRIATQPASGLDSSTGQGCVRVGIRTLEVNRCPRRILHLYSQF